MNESVRKRQFLSQEVSVSFLSPWTKETICYFSLHWDFIMLEVIAKTGSISYLSGIWPPVKQQIKSMGATKRIQKPRTEVLKIEIQQCVDVHLGQCCRDILKSCAELEQSRSRAGNLHASEFLWTFRFAGSLQWQSSKGLKLFLLSHLPTLFH